MLQDLRKVIFRDFSQPLQSPLNDKFNTFTRSPNFIFLIGIITVISNFLGIELLGYTIFLVTACCIALYGTDFMPMLILVTCCYIMPSPKNNPGRQTASVFSPFYGGIFLIFLFIAFIFCVIYRIKNDPELGFQNLLKKKRSLLTGMLILGAGYVMAGAFSGRYFDSGLLFDKGIMNTIFAIVQFLSVSLLYWLFSATIRWEKVPVDYIAWAGLTTGLTVCCELVSVFLFNHVIQGGIIRTGLIFSGWGNANNIGCMIAMMIPFAIYLGRRTERAFQFNLIAIGMLAFVCFTCSRTSMLVAFLMYGVSIISILWKAPKGKAKREFLIFNSIILLGIIAICIVFYRQIAYLFQELVIRGMDPRGRQSIYPAGISTFLSHPVFGDSFYPNSYYIYEWSTVEQFKAIFPGRWHNTVIQLLASCGAFGLICYSVHRLQTIWLFWKKRNTQTLYIGLVLLSLLLMSLLDCHFFNIGPTLFYSAALAYTEYMPEEIMYEKHRKKK